MSVIPVIAIDGPAASGKGTVAERVAGRLGFHYLDSGALYRLVAVAAARAGIDPDHETAVAAVAAALDVRFASGRVWLAGADVSEAIRTETAGADASRVAVLGAVRRALVDRQRAFRTAPGLVADGRDMGSAIFPDATLKIFLTASAEVRAERRYKQLMEKGIRANIAVVLKDIQERDARDSSRAAAPLRQCPDAHLLETSNLSIDEAVDAVLHRYPAIHD